MLVAAALNVTVSEEGGVTVKKRELSPRFHNTLLEQRSSFIPAIFWYQGKLTDAAEDSFD